MYTENQPIINIIYRDTNIPSYLKDQHKQGLLSDEELIRKADEALRWLEKYNGRDPDGECRFVEGVGIVGEIEGVN